MATPDWLNGTTCIETWDPNLGIGIVRRTRSGRRNSVVCDGLWYLCASDSIRIFWNLLPSSW